MIKLNLGCGKKILPGYINIDLFPLNHHVKKADVADTGYKSNEVNEIFISHTIEHIEPDHFVKALKHWYDILIPEGVLIILTPNAELYIREWINASDNKDYDYLQGWGLRNVLGWGGISEGMWNRNLFTPEILKRYVIEVGFDIVKCETQETRVKNKAHIEYRPNGDIICMAQKLV